MEEFFTDLMKQAPVLGVFALSMLYLFRWFATKIAEPLTENHIKFTNSICESSDRTAAATEVTSQCVKEMRETQKEHLAVCRDGHK